MSDVTGPPLSESFDATGTWRQAGRSSQIAASAAESRASSELGRAGAAGRSEVLANLPAIGQRLGSFVIEQAIGVGGMGAVFRALDQRLERHVALKLLPPETAGDVEVVQRFYQEARAAARLDHENIARVYSIEHDHDGAYHYIVFEYIEGITIRKKVAADGPLSVAEAINYTLQIASALVHATERGVVHRDIKPSNIIVTPHGRAKLVDMGLARRFERGASADDGLTQTGMTLGTFDYISPEQARDPRDVDVRSDLYSLGCTLFHMLTGRPPFPEGTVLQKLLQHQEEPPPDVCAINPAVPADLAAVITKLMAKDRDRRYQTPEQLVRDLLTIAGSLGLRSISPEGLIWMSATAPAPWERHLVWGIPAIVLAMVVVILVWLSQPTDTSSAGLYDEASSAAQIKKAVIASTSASPTASPSPTAPLAPQADTEGGVPAKAQSSPPAARLAPYSVGSSAELAQALAEAPDNATIILVTDGPFELPTLAEPARRNGSNVTLRAAPKAHPVFRASPKQARDQQALLSFGPGQVTLEGIEFQVAPAIADESAFVALEALDTDLTVRRCSFRSLGPTSAPNPSPSPNPSPNPGAALRLVSSRSDDRPPPVVLEACWFDGGRRAVWARGPLDLQVRDCEFGPAGPVFWLDNPPTEEIVPARIVLRHVSALAGSGPVLRASRTALTVRVDDSVIAAAPKQFASLLETDLPDQVEWLGRGNLYARIDPYLKAPAHSPGTGPIHRFEAWAEDATRTREIDSAVTEGAVWASSDPLGELAAANPTAAFQLDGGELPTLETGARRSPWGAILRGSAESVAQLPAGRPAESGPAAANTKPTEPTPAAPAGPPTEPPMSLAPSAAPPGTASWPNLPGPEPSQATTSPVRPAPGGPDTGAAVASAQPAATRPQADAASVATAPAPAAPVATPTSPSPMSPSPSPATAPPTPAFASEPSSPERTQAIAELMTVLDQPRAPSEPIRLAAGVDYTLAPHELKGEGRWVITGPDSTSATRPRLRLRPEALSSRDPLSRHALFRLDELACLDLRNVDLIVSPTDLPLESPLVLFELGPGAELSLTRCTITMSASWPRSAVIALSGPAPTPAAADDEGRSPDKARTTSVWTNDCFIRSGTDIFDLADAGQFSVEMTNSVVATAGAVVHGHGSARDRNLPQPSTKLTLRLVTCRSAGGLVLLESTNSQPGPPRTEITVRDSILSTTPSSEPLIRIDGLENTDDLRDQVHWVGHGVAYHQIEVYRRDQTNRPGSVPLLFKKADWEVAVGPREEAPFHGDVKFATPWPEGRPVWATTIDDVRLAPASPVKDLGPDLATVPVPPASN